MSYVMESERENQRLAAQAAADPVTPRLCVTGLREGMRALDLGCGPGVTSLAMADLVGERGEVVGLDRSAARVDEARRSAAGRANLSFLEGDAFALPFPDASFDYCWSQFVFEYFPDRTRPLQELLRVLRPGGVLALADVDRSGFLNWPFPPELEAGLRTLQGVLQGQGFDPLVGRKLYSELRAAGFADVKVRLEPHYIHAGAADARALEDWRVRFAALEKVATPAFGDAAAYQAFAEAFLRFWGDDSALKYSVLLITWGTRA